MIQIRWAFGCEIDTLRVVYAHCMARICDITGKKSQVGGGYSNRTRATKFNPTGARRRLVNIQKKTLFIPELGKKVTINVSAGGLKTMKKRGAYKTLKAAGLVK